MPGSSDDVDITPAGTYTVTLDVDATVASLTLGGASGAQTLSSNSHTFTLNGASTIGVNGVLDLDGGNTGRAPAPGVYLLRFRSEHVTQVRRLLLLR